MTDTFFSVLETLGEAALLTDADLNLVVLNSAAQTLYEVNSQQMLGRKLVDLIGTSVSDTQTEGWVKVLRGDVWRGVVWHQKPNRQRFRAEVSVRALFDQNNALEGVIAIVKDVTSSQAESIRQKILSRCLRAIGDISQIDALYQLMLEILTTKDAADAAIFRLRESAGYRLTAVAGVEMALLEPIRIGDFSQEEPAFLQGEIVTVEHPAMQGTVGYDLARKLGFRRLEMVGQRVAGEVIGSISLLYRQDSWLDLRPILPEIAAALGSRLEREHAKARLESERKVLEVLALVSSQMRQAVNRLEVYQIATDFVLQASQASSAFVLLANPERTELRPMAGSGLQVEPMLSQVLTRERGLSWQVLDTGVTRVEQSALPEAFTLRPLAQGAYIGVPISREDQVVGVLCADTQTDSEYFSAVDLDCLTAITKELCSALTRLEALETVQRRADAFAQLAQLSSDLEQLEDEQLIATCGLKALVDLTGLDVGVYFTLNNQFLVASAQVGNLSPDYLAWRQNTPITADDTFGKVAQRGTIALIPDLTLAPDANPNISPFDFRTAVIAPVQTHGKVRGFICASSIDRLVTFAPNTQEILEFIVGRLARAIERAEGIQEIIDTRVQAFRTIGLALELRDFETKGHTDRVVELSLQLGKAVGLNEPQLQALEWGALLHDIGKVAVPDQVLLKPGKLNADEWLWIRQHPRIGFQMIEGLRFLPPETLEIVLYHQERSDGSGYPDNLKLEEIPYLARLFAVVDVFDALTSQRPYKDAWSLERAILELQRQAGTTLDPILVGTFLQTLNAPILAIA